MSDQTDVFDLPYLELDDPADIETAVKPLADRLETILVNLLGANDKATARDTLGLEIGSDVQAYSAALAAIAAAGYVPPTSYTPAWTGSVSNPVIGDGTLRGRYARIGKIVTFTAEVIAGAGTTFGSGNYALSLPLPAAAGGRWNVPFYLLDTSVQHYIGMANILGGASVTEFIAAGSSGSGPTDWSNTNPFTMGNFDRAVLSGTYEAA